MMQSGDWLLPHMFEQLYLRKPPGMPWAIALFSTLLGQNEFAARLVSAIATLCSSLLCFRAARRWFGSPYGIYAGLAFLLTPLFWTPGRSAEIEAIHNAFTLGAALSLLALLLHTARHPRRTALALAACFAGMCLTKGPSGLPCIFGAAAGACIATRSWRPLRTPLAWLGLAIGVLPVGIYALLAWNRLATLHESAIVEPPSHFLWNSASAVLLLPFAALASAAPQSLSLLVLPLTRSLPPASNRPGHAVTAACVASLLTYTAIGVSNPRYAMPALTLLPLCVAFVFARWHHAAVPARFRFVQGRYLPLALALLLILSAAAHALWMEQRRDQRTSGRDEGLKVGALLENNAQLWAFEMIDQRPEILYYARRAAAQAGRNVRVRWVPIPESRIPLLPPPGSYLLLRTDTRPRDQYPPELPAYVENGFLSQFGKSIYEGKVHNFSFALYRIPQINTSE